MGLLKNILIKYDVSLWGIFRKLLINNYKKEVNKYTNFLKEHDDNFITTWLAEAILFRVDLENEGTLSSTRLEDGTISPELIGLVPLWSSLEDCRSQLSRDAKELTGYMILSLWYYTVLCLIKPDLVNEGKDMWHELERGLKNANIELKRLIVKRYDDPSTRIRAFDILNELPPKQLNDSGFSKYIYFQCESCGQKLRIPIKKEPLKITCPTCKNIFFIENGKKTLP